ncbi:ribonuclease H1-like [Schistocerca gregaria]|uniref:ribonuclease H1-like n=1 Tax=Schistocerca gregaria TaxID=7010 RepID=UPI00211EF37D|nr:ribonuclease H1-like [Schistocerca gregaria]
MSEILKSFSPQDDDTVTAFVYGVYERDGRRGSRGGVGVWFGENHTLNISESLESCYSKSNAEIKAAARAIEHAKAAGIKKLCIKTDSEFLVKSASHWSKAGCTLEAGGSWAQNQEDYKVLYDAITDSGMEIRWHYVPGHSGIEGNQKADALARLGAQMSANDAGDATLSENLKSKENYSRYY